MTGNELQYWFFYAYNDWAGGYGGFNDHEGDWEGFHVFFKLDAGNRPIESPAYFYYLGHHSRITKPWDHPDVKKVGPHPVIYVAAGSHASYPEAKQYLLIVERCSTASRIRRRLCENQFNKAR